MGVRKVGRIATTGQSLEASDVTADNLWAADPAWIKKEQIQSFAGHPIIHRGEVLGVLALFARVKPGNTCFEWFRIIAATNRDLRAEAESGRFRQDLYYRLSVFPLELPPLRMRLEDVPLLAEHFLARFARQLGQPRFKLTMANIQDLQRYSWPGNVRELQHVLERACIVSERGRLKFDHLRESIASTTPMNAAQAEERILTVAELRDLEVRNIQAALKRSNGKFYGDDGAAALLGTKPTTLTSRIKSLGIESD